MGPLVRYAAPFMSFQFMQVVLMSVETRMGSVFGAASLAAHQITYSVWRPLICLGDPIMQAALSMLPSHLADGAAAGRARARELAAAILKVAVGLAVISGLVGLALGVCLPPLFTADPSVVSEAVGLAVPMVGSIVGLAIWHCNQGMMLATGRAKLLATLYIWNIVYYSSASLLVIRSGLTLYHAWWVWASMHGIFSLIVSVVLRLPGGIFAAGR
jgi:Na+-driven multidrug efflux pump